MVFLVDGDVASLNQTGIFLHFRSKKAVSLKISELLKVVEIRTKSRYVEEI